jgi:hypothetical protein
METDDVAGSGWQWNAPGLTDTQYCSVGCPDSWIGDKYCDRACRNRNCAFDAGDCDVEEIYKSVHGYNLTKEV